MPKYTLKRTKEAQCCICIGSIDKKAETRITCCRHRYHFKCIQKWSQRENRCPLCRKRFNWMILVHNKKRYKIAKRDQTDDNSSLVGNILYSFFYDEAFRDSLLIGVYERSRSAIKIFQLIRDIINYMRQMGRYPASLSESAREEACDWLDTIGEISV